MQSVGIIPNPKVGRHRTIANKTLFQKIAGQFLPKVDSHKEARNWTSGLARSRNQAAFVMTVAAVRTDIVAECSQKSSVRRSILLNHKVNVVDLLADGVDAQHKLT
jgi:hypothetical protein